MSDTEKTTENETPAVETPAAEIAAEPIVALVKSEPVQESEPTAVPDDPKRLWHSRIRVSADRIVAAAAAVLAVAALVLGVAWHNASGDLNALRTSNSDRDRAAEIASDYTVRSLSYDYKNLPAFFDNVERGTSDALRGKYTQAHDMLTKIMSGAQVVATGQVVGTSVESKGNDQYQVTVYAIQRTQNVQQPEPAAKPNLLVVTVAKSGGDWLVVDYGPKDGVTTDGVSKDGAAK